MNTVDTLHDAFLHELYDMYDAEKQLVKALPKMMEGVHSDELRSAISEHLEQTEEHVERLERVFESLGEEAKEITCKGMKGLIEEGEELLKMEPSAALDAAIISAAQKVEHYEIATYGALCEFAKLMKHKEALKLLEATIDEEKKADKLLTKIAKPVNKEANVPDEAPSMRKQPAMTR